MIKRQTIQLNLIYDEVNKLQCHATADEVYNSIVVECPNISRGTVYRNLNRLAKTGKIKKLEMPKGADRFDHCTHNHYHAKCLKCGKVFDVEMEFMDGLENKIKNTNGFKFSGHNIIFTGICQKCR